MNLEDYYCNCEKKYEFASRVAKRCGVSLNAVLKWCKGYNKTDKPERLKILSEESGIEIKDLF